MKTTDWACEGEENGKDLWRCRWCGNYSTELIDFPHTEDCDHWWDNPPQNKEEV